MLPPATNSILLSDTSAGFRIRGSEEQPDFNASECNSLKLEAFGVIRSTALAISSCELAGYSPTKYKMGLSSTGWLDSTLCVLSHSLPDRREYRTTIS